MLWVLFGINRILAGIFNALSGEERKSFQPCQRKPNVFPHHHCTCNYHHSTFKRTRKTTDKKRARSTTQTTVKTELIETEEPLLTEENSSDDLYSNDYNNNYDYNYGYDNSYNNGYDNSYNNGYDNGYNNGNGYYEPATDAPNYDSIPDPEPVPSEGDAGGSDLGF